MRATNSLNGIEPDLAPKKPPHKRRRLESTQSSNTPHLDVTVQDNIYPDNNVSSMTCTACHRSLSINLSPTTTSGNTAPSQGAYQFVICARCSAPTCTICSRTCTARAPSQPPTPCLTYSPSPSPILRTALTLLSNPNTNTDVNATPTASRRRKVRDDEPESDGEEPEPGLSKDAPAGRHVGRRLFSGCGRTVCRNCCFENLESNSVTTTCYDCYGHSS